LRLPNGSRLLRAQGDFGFAINAKGIACDYNLTSAEPRAWFPQSRTKFGNWTQAATGRSAIFRSSRDDARSREWELHDADQYHADGERGCRKDQLEF
jgi:hypothetical protein